MTDQQKWEQARINEMIAVSQLRKLNSDGAVSHSQAETILTGFCRKSGFTQISTLFKNLRDERGWTYTETK